LNKYIKEFYIDPNSHKNIYKNLAEESPEREEEIMKLIDSHKRIYENTSGRRTQDSNALDNQLQKAQMKKMKKTNHFSVHQF
jgi:replicative superfamily II helicase